MSEAEKEVMLNACKYVDEIVFDVPYASMLEVLDREDVQCDFVAHGDDAPAIGDSMYGPARDAGRFKMFRRSEGISTTWIINRLIAATSNSDEEHHENKTLTGGPIQNFSITSQRMSYFTNYPQVSVDAAKCVVYIDGDWDFLHPGHVKVLEAANKYGDFVLVGVHGDSTVRTYRGSEMYPVLSCGERSINLLSCKWVHDVVIDAPLTPSHDMLLALNIKVVLKVTNHHDFVNVSPERFSCAESMGLMEEMDMSGNDFSSQTIVTRFLNSREEMLARNNKKHEPSMIPKEESNAQIKAVSR